MANRKKCLSLGLKFAKSLFSTQVLPPTHLSQYPSLSGLFKSQSFFSSTPRSVVEVLTSNEWSESTKKQLEESNIEISHEFVIYVLKKLEKEPLKALEFFNWACKEKLFRPNSLAYSLLVRVLGGLNTMKQFWVVIKEMMETGFYLDEGTYLTVSGNLKKAGLQKENIGLKHFNQRMIQENGKEDVVYLILGSDWNNELENNLHDLKLSVTDDLVMRVMKKLRNEPLKAYRFFKWVEKFHGNKVSSVAYNVMARVLSHGNTIKEFRDVIMDMRSKRHEMDIDTYIKVSRSLQKSKMLKEAVELYEYMMDSPYPPSSQDGVLLLKSICSGTDVDLTFRVVKKFEDGGNSLSKPVYDSIHRCLTAVGKFDEAEKILETMRSGGYEPDNYSYSQLVYGYRKAGRLEDACKVLEEMEANGCKADIVTWTILITGFCEAGRIDLAVLKFAEMMEKNIVPDADLLDVLVRAFVAHKKVYGACKLVAEMVEKANLKPWQATYKLLTEKLLEEGKLEEAFKMIPMMKKQGYPPCTQAFVEYISKIGSVEDARMLLASVSVKELPSSSCYLVVLRSFMKEGRISEAREILYSCPPHIRSHKEVKNLFGAA